MPTTQQIKCEIQDWSFTLGLIGFVCAIVFGTIFLIEEVGRVNNWPSDIVTIFKIIFGMSLVIPLAALVYVMTKIYSALRGTVNNEATE